MIDTNSLYFTIIYHICSIDLYTAGDITSPILVSNRLCSYALLAGAANQVQDLVAATKVETISHKLMQGFVWTYGNLW